MLRILFGLTGLIVFTLDAQPRAPLQSEAARWTQVPPIQNHITGLSGSIAGRPMPVRPGARPIPVVPGWFGGGGWYPQQQWQPQTTPLVLVNQQNVAPPQAPILVVNPDYKSEAAQPVLREYSKISNPYEDFEPKAQKVFLLALKDGSLRQSVAFWAEGGKLHFVQPDHKQDSIPLANLDRESSKRFNSERGLDLRLPEE